MAISTKINITEFAEDPSIRIDFKYVNYLNKTKINSTLSEFIEVVDLQATDVPDEFDYVEIGNLKSSGKIFPNLINLNIRNFDNEDLINKIEKGDIQSVDNNDILLSSVRPNLKKIILIDEKNKHLFFTKAFHKIRSKINPKICYYLLKFVYFDTLNSIARMGKGYPTLKKGDLPLAKINNINFLNFIKNENQIINKIDKLENEISNISKKLVNEKEIINRSFEKTYNYDFSDLYKKYYPKTFKIDINKLNNSNDLRLGFKFRNPFRDKLLDLCSNFSKLKIKDYIDIPVKLGQTVTESDLDNSSDKLYLTMAEIKTFYLDISETSKVSEDFYNEFKDVNSTKLNDILLARSGEGTIGKIAMVDKEIEGLFADFLMRIRFKNYPSNYAYYFFRTDLFQELINLTKKGLGNNTNIYPSDISDFPIPDPNIKLKNCCENISKIISENRSRESQILDLNNKIADIIKYYSN